MFNENTRWKVLKHLKQNKIRFIFSFVVIFLVFSAEILGLFFSLQEPIEKVEFKIRGEQKNVAASIVLFDRAFQKKSNIPYSPLVLEKVLKSVHNAGASEVAIRIIPGVFDTSSTKISCHASDIFLGRVRPKFLPKSCLWEMTENNEDIVRVFTNREKLELQQVRTNWSGSVHSISASHLVGDKFLPEAFRDQFVFVDTLPIELNRRMKTPFGEANEATQITERILSSRNSQDFWPGRKNSSGYFYIYFLLFIAIYLGTLAAKFKQPLFALTAIGITSLFISMGLFSVEIYFPLFSFFFSVIIASLIWSFVPQYFEESALEIRTRLQNSIATASARRPKHLATEDAFWKGLIGRTAQDLSISVSSIAELKSGDWWIEFKAFTGMEEMDIIEQRRDVRRQPYAKSFREGEIRVSKNYHRDASLSSVFVPLFDTTSIAQREPICVGFWVFHLSRPKAFLDKNRGRILQIAEQVAHEIAMHQIGIHKSILLSHKVDSETVIRTAMTTLDYLESDRKILERLVENSEVGLLILDLWGEVLYENEKMSALLSSVISDNPRFEYLFAILSRTPVKEISFLLKRAYASGEKFEILAKVETTLGPRVMIFLFSPIRYSKDSRERIRSIAVSATDLTRFDRLSEEHHKLGKLVAGSILEIVHATKLLADTLKQSQTLALNKKISSELFSLSDRLHLNVEDFEAIIDPTVQTQTRYLFSLKSLLFEVFADQSLPMENPNKELNKFEILPLRGFPEQLKEAFCFIILDGVSFSVSENISKFTIQEGKESVTLHFVFGEASIPESMLQRLLDMDLGMDINSLSQSKFSQQESKGIRVFENTSSEARRLAIASRHISKSGGTLEAKIDKYGDLSFSVRLLKHLPLSTEGKK